MANLAGALKRLRDETTLSRYRLPVGVADDVRELLRDYDRLDGIVRLMYEPHVNELRTAVEALEEGREKLTAALYRMSADTRKSVDYWRADPRSAALSEKANG